MRFTPSPHLPSSPGRVISFFSASQSIYISVSFIDQIFTVHWRDLKFLAGIKQHGLFLWVPSMESAKKRRREGWTWLSCAMYAMMLGMVVIKGDTGGTQGGFRGWRNPWVQAGSSKGGCPQGAPWESLSISGVSMVGISMVDISMVVISLLDISLIGFSMVGISP